jgi:DNA-binding IclR family transcriptional regulator
MSKPPREERYIVPGLERGLQMLAQFTRQSPLLSGAELSKRMGLPRASVFRMIYTLEQAGLLERAQDGVNYRLGIGVLRLGFELLSSMDITELGRPIIDALRDDTGYSSHLVVLDGQEVVFVAKAPGRQALFHSIQLGARLPAHATVLGRILLGDHDLHALAELFPTEPLKAYTDKTPTTRKGLFELIQADRNKGYGLSMGGFETGISTIAAPVFRANHHIAAAISITVPSSQIEAQAIAPLVEHVQRAAQALSNRLLSASN